MSRLLNRHFVLVWGLLSLVLFPLAAQTMESKDIFNIVYEGENVWVEIGNKRLGPYSGIDSVDSNPKGQFAILVLNTDMSYSVLTQQRVYGPYRHPQGFGLIRVHDSGAWSASLFSDSGQVQLVVNGDSQGNFQEIAGVSFTADGRQWTGVIKKPNNRFAFIGPVRIDGEFTEVRFADLLANGQLFAHVAGPDGGEYIHAGGRRWGPMEVYAAYALKGTAYFAFYGTWRKGRDTEYIVVVNGEEYDGEALMVDLEGAPRFTWISYSSEGDKSIARFHTFIAGE